MAKETKDGKPTTATTRTETTTKEVVKHIQKLAKARERNVSLNMKALAPAIAAIDEEIGKARTYAIKQFEKELDAAIKGE